MNLHWNQRTALTLQLREAFFNREIARRIVLDLQDRGYDLKKFRFIRCATLGIVFILAFLMGFCEFKHSEIYLTAALVVIFLHYYIILHHCKRKGEK